MNQIKNTIIRITFAFLCTLMAIPTLAQTRDVKDIKKLVKKAPYTDNFHFESIGFGWKAVPYNFVSLKDLDATVLNITEKDLLEKYEDVAFCFNGGKIHYCYWVKDSYGNVGLVKFDGSILVPPVKGRVLQGTHPDRIVIGEQTLTPSEWLKEYNNRVTKLNGIGLGHFAAVVDDIKSDKIRATIPAGMYDDIMYGIKGTHTYYFVGKIIDGELKWGVVDKDGKEEMAVEHKGIYKKKGAGSWLVGNVGGKWVATEDMDMSEIENVVRNEEELAMQRREQIAGSLMAFSNVLEQSAELVGSIQGSGNETPKDAASIPAGGNFESLYRQWENRAKANYNSLTNLGYKVKKDGKDVAGSTDQSMSSSNYTAMKKALREAQTEMKEIRSKAAKQGIKITRSEYEDVQVKY